MASAPVRQEVARSRRLVRYAADSGPCSSNNQDAPFASHEPALRSWYLGNNPGSRAWLTKSSDSLACGLCGSRVGDKSADAVHSGNREEKVPCSSSTRIGVSAASSVPKAKEPVSDNRKKKTEENPVKRRLRMEKKEENFSVNPSKKMQRKKVPSHTARFAPVRFRPRHHE